MVKLTRRTLMTLYTALISYLLLSSNAMAATLLAVVNSNQVTQAEVFQLRIIFDEKVDSDSIDFKSLETDFFLGQPSFASSLNYTNSKRSSTSEWSIALKAKSIGKTIIPAFHIDGANSQPIEIIVSVDTDLPSQNELVEIQSQLSRTTLYPDESAELRTRLIIKADIRRLQNPNFFAPAIEANNLGISVEEQGKAKQYKRLINGVEVTVFDQVFLITAEKAGNYTLNSLGFSATVVHGNNRTGTTKLIPIEIIPEQFQLVVKEKPTEFSEQWIPTSALNFTQRWLDANGQPLATDAELSINVGDSMTRELTLMIHGLKPERFPKFETQYPSALRQYAEKPQYSQLTDGNYQMTVKQVLIAQKTGTFTLPAIPLEWWNTTSDSKEISTLKGRSIAIEANDAPITPAIISPPSKEPPVVIEYDRSYWPYLTALFALLWLITLTWHIKTRMASLSKVKLATLPVESTAALLCAVTQQDIAKVQHLAMQWLQQQAPKDQKLADKIKRELVVMNSSLYSGLAAQWDNTMLIKMIQQLDKKSAFASKHSTPLPNL